ncbi:MAG: nucleotide pyrophosphohydrolase [Anaerolineales bacterium]|jgi:NTP pyrophosphatase (non-canonical NTP hydrolase)
MDIKSLTQEMHRFVDAKGWYQEDSPKQQSPKNLAVSMAIETAEVLELFQWDQELPERDELASELADVGLYLLQLSSVAGIDLERAILDKLELNYNRDW